MGDAQMTTEKTPWSLRKDKGSVACYSDVVNADGHPVCCAHDDYASLIVAAVNAYRSETAPQRYNVVATDRGTIIPVKAPNGEWVRYEDLQSEPKAEPVNMMPERCMSAGCQNTAMASSVLCQQHYDELPPAMRGVNRPAEPESPCEHKKGPFSAWSTETMAGMLCHECGSNFDVVHFAPSAENRGAEHGS